MNPEFIIYQGTIDYSINYMRLALIGDSVIYLNLNVRAFYRLRGPQSRIGNLISTAKSNETMKEYCRLNNYFSKYEGKAIADNFEAYVGWLTLHNYTFDELMDDFFLFCVNRANDPFLKWSCPLLRQLQPSYF